MKFDRRFSQIEEWRSKNMTVGELLWVMDAFLLTLAAHTTPEQYETIRKVAESELRNVAPAVAETCHERWAYPRRADEH